MATPNLTRYETSEGIELVIDNETGESFATVKGYTRMSGKANSTITERVARLEDIKSAEILTTQGLRMARLIPANLVFKWMLKDNPELAEVMGCAGATLYMQHLAGFKLPQKEIETPKALTSYEKATCVNNMAASLQFFGVEISNPRFKQSAKDLVCDILGFNQNITALNESKEIWLGVAERAEQLGYPVQLVNKYRSSLGKAVKKQVAVFKEEKRLCNGTERDIKLYKLSDELDTAIRDYMNAKVAVA